MRSRSLVLSVLAAIAATTALRAQTVPSDTPPTDDKSPVNDSPIQLPTFTINSEKDIGYVGKSALSSTRIAVDLSELPQSAKVLNNSFVTAIGPTMLSDILNYVGGGQNGQLNWTPGRMNIRGFTGDADYVDGFAPPAATAQDSAVFDRFEIIKGPSAIFLAADGSPGGIQNKITKDAQTVASTEISVQTGLFAANHVTFNSTGPLTKDKKLTYRLVAAGAYWDDYYKYTYMHRLTALGVLEYAFTPNTKLTIKSQIVRADWPSYNGLPVDPRTLKMIDLPYDSTQDLDKPQNWRHDIVNRVWANFSSRLNDNVALSVRGMQAFDKAWRYESIAPTWSEGTTTGTALISGVSTPVTFLGGKWTTPATVGSSESVAPVNYVVKDGVTYVTDSWAGTPTYAGGAIPRSTINSDDAHTAYKVLQADMNFNYTGKEFTELLLIGGEYRSSPSYTVTWKNGVSTTPWFPYAPDTPATVVSNYSAPSAYTLQRVHQMRGYILETLKLLDNRLILNYGLSRANTHSSNYNGLTNTWIGVPGGFDLSKNLVQYGVVFKVRPNISLFTGSNQNFAANGTGTYNGVPNSVLPAKTGKQREVGIKSEFLKKRLSVNVSYFDVKQQNNTVPSFPNDPLNPNVLIPGVISRGFDGDLSFKVNSNLYIMGSFANYSAKSILGATFDGAQGAIFLQPATGKVANFSIPVNNTAQHTMSCFALYQFNTGDLKGLSIGFGGNYQSKRAVTDGPNQVFWGYIPGRIVVDANLRYEHDKHISYALSINNVLNKKYIYSSRSEDVLVPGAPFNAKFSITYKL